MRRFADYRATLTSDLLIACWQGKRTGCYSERLWYTPSAKRHDPR